MARSPAASAAAPGGDTERPRPSGLADVLKIILDKGIVIDAYVRVSLVGIELLTIDARIVVASVDTYLRFAEAVGRLEIANDGSSQGLPQLIETTRSRLAKAKTTGAIEGTKEALFGTTTNHDRRVAGQRSGGATRHTDPVGTPGEVILRLPLPQARRQQQLLLAITRQEVLRHHQRLLNPADRPALCDTLYGMRVVSCVVIYRPTCRHRWEFSRPGPRSPAPAGAAPPMFRYLRPGA